MRFFAQVSQDEALLDDFRAGRDAHIRLARDTHIAYKARCSACRKELRRVVRRVPSRQDAPRLDASKNPASCAKNGNYLFLNMGSAQRVRQIAETSPEPIHLPPTIDVCGEDRDPWEVVRERWRESTRRATPTRKHDPRGGQAEPYFDFTDGEYGAVWSDGLSGACTR